MIIILKNIPAKTTKQDLQNFLMPAVKGGWFDKKGRIVDISILVQRNLRTRVIAYYGLVTIVPDIVCERVIKKMNCKSLLGKHIALAEYKKRDIKNDPRLRHKSSKVVFERRICDRRDEYEILSEEQFSLIERKNFHRMG